MWQLLLAVHFAVAVGVKLVQPGQREEPLLYVWEHGDDVEVGSPVEGRDVSGSHDRIRGSSDTSSRSAAPQGRLLLPKAKLAFCNIPAVASTQMSELFAELNGGNGTDDASARSSPGGLGIDWKDVTKENGWRFAFLTRDPLARYLSAFGSKCVVSARGSLEDDGGSCEGPVLGKPSSLEAMVTTFQSRVRLDSARGVQRQKAHWASMSDQLRSCSGEDPSKFSPDTASHASIDQGAGRRVRRILQNAGVMRAYPEARRLVAKYFPLEGARERSRRSYNTEGIFYNSSWTASAVKALYSEDYLALRLPLLSDATLQPQPPLDIP